MDSREYAEYLFDRIPTGSENALKRPPDKRTDRALRRLIEDANMSGDLIINTGAGYFRPGEDDDVAFEDYYAAERARAWKILRKTSRMREVFDRRYE